MRIAKEKTYGPRKNFLSLKLNQNGKERDSHTHKHFTMMNLSSPPNNQHLNCGDFHLYLPHTYNQKEIHSIME